MYTWGKNLLERLIRIPPQPKSPPGDDESTRVFNAAPHYFTYKLVKGAIAYLSVLLSLSGGAIGIFASMGTLLDDIGSLIAIIIVVILVLLVIAVLAYFVIRLDYEKRWYVVTDRSLRIREGVINVHEMTITFANIQNIAVSQGPLQRLFGISDLQVETAGGATPSAGGGHYAAANNLSTASFRGVNNADEIRDLMQERLRLLKDSGLGDTDDKTSSLVSQGSPVQTTFPVSASTLSALEAVLTEARNLRKAATGFE